MRRRVAPAALMLVLAFGIAAISTAAVAQLVGDPMRSGSVVVAGQQSTGGQGVPSPGRVGPVPTWWLNGESMPPGWDCRQSEGGDCHD